MNAFHRIAASLVVIIGIATSAAAGDPERLIDALSRQDVQTVRAMVKTGADVNARRADGASPLMWAAHWDDVPSARVLIQAGADVNAANDLGVTALDLACENGSAGMVKALVGAGAKTSGAQKDGTTPLMTAARTGSVEIVKLLLAGGAHVNAATTATTQTALMWAISDRHRDVVRVLLEAGADPNASSHRGFTPLMYTALHGDVEIAKTLIAAGADVNRRGSQGDGALPLAIVVAQDEFALFLLEHGADPNGTIGGVGALHAAAGTVDQWLRDWMFGQHEARETLGLPTTTRVALAKALLARGADVNGRITSNGTAAYYLAPRNGAFDDAATGTGNLKGATPLLVAMFSPPGGSAGESAPNASNAESGPTAVARVLLAAGADPNAAAVDGTTPLLAAAGVGRAGAASRPGSPNPVLERIRLLVEAGAKIEVANEGRFTALHRAAFSGNEDVIRYLAGKGAKINAQDFRGRTPYRIAEGAKVGFSLVKQPEIAAVLQQLGADTELGPSWEVLERELARKTAGNADDRK